MTSSYFNFEKDFTDSLRCIPMAVRFKLDVSGIKLKLSEWARLDPGERALLVTSPCRTSPEIEMFRSLLSALVIKACGISPSEFTVSDETPLWEKWKFPRRYWKKPQPKRLR